MNVRWSRLCRLANSGKPHAAQLGQLDFASSLLASHLQKQPSAACLILKTSCWVWRRTTPAPANARGSRASQNPRRSELLEHPIPLSFNYDGANIGTHAYAVSIEDSDDDGSGEGEMDMDLESESDDDVPNPFASSSKPQAAAKPAAGANPYPLEGKYLDEYDRERWVFDLFTPHTRPD